MLDINSSEEGVIVLDMSVGNVGIESNGHGMSRLENGDLEDTMRSLKMDVLSFQADNTRLVKKELQLNNEIL